MIRIKTAHNRLLLSVAGQWFLGQERNNLNGIFRGNDSG